MSAAEPTPATSATGGIRSSRLPSIAAGVATPIVIVALAILPFLTPLWFFAGQERAQADAWTGWPIETVHVVTGAVLADVVLGPPDFDQVVDGSPVFNEREKGHLRDVRTLLIGFAILAALAAAVLAAAWWQGRGRSATWRGARTGAKVLAVAIVAIGIFAAVAFDTAFALFHTLLFAEGTYAFDPATERMVQLFPESFWYETAIAVGAMIVVLSIATFGLATWRIRRIERAAAVSSPMVANGATVP